MLVRRGDRVLGLRGRVITALLGKEAREVLRDRRTLLLTLLLPAVIYPLLLAGMGQVTAAAVASLRERMVTVAVSPAVPQDVVNALGRTSHVEVKTTEDPLRAVQDGDARAGLRPEPGATAPGALQLVLDGANDESRAAAERVDKALSEVREDRLKARLGKLGVDQAFLEPLPVTRRNTSPPERMKAYGAARILPFLLIVLSLMGAMAAAVDSTAGERERGTLLTLLSTPVRAGEVAAAKLAVVTVVALAAGLANLLSMGLTLSSSLASAPGLSLSLGPGLIFQCVLALLPTTLYGAALLLGLAALGKTTREAQTMTAPAMFSCLGLAGVVAVPGVQASTALNVLPVAGPALLMRDVLMGEAHLSQVLTVGVASAVTLWLVVAFTARVLTSEPMVSNQVSTAAVIRDLSGARQPTALTAALLAALLLAAAVYAVPLAGVEHLLWGLVTTQALLLSVAVGLLAALRLDVRGLMGLVHRPPLRALVAAALLGGSLAVPLALAEGWLVRVSGMEKVLEEAARSLQQLVAEQLTPGRAVLAIGVLPGIVEELAFRGALQGVLRKVARPAWAVTVQAVVFGLAHGSVLRFPPTFFLGLVLGGLRQRSGSVLPGMLLHVLHNSLLATTLQLATSGQDETLLQETLLGPGTWAGVALALLTALGLLWRMPPRGT